MPRSTFVVVDGTDGSGKTSVMEFLKDKLRQKSLTFFATEESTRDTFGLAIRRLIQTVGSIDPWALQMLFITDRINHRRAIQAALHAGEVVICDRYLYSGIAFGTYDICSRLPEMNAGEVRNQLIAIHRALPIPLPNLALVMSVPAPLAIQRIAARVQEQFLDRFETEQAIGWVHQEFKYLVESKLFPEMTLVDNSGELQSTLQSVWRLIEPLLPA